MARKRPKARRTRKSPSARKVATAPKLRGRLTVQPMPIRPTTPTRGHSIQGHRQAAKGGPAGANQGGAPRGSSRLEPSHQKNAARGRRVKPD